MTYVNLTGKNIGDCLTGFAINYPFTIFNSGNSDIFYQKSIFYISFCFKSLYIYENIFIFFYYMKNYSYTIIDRVLIISLLIA